MNDRDLRRYSDLKKKEEEGTLSYTEKIELELLESGIEEEERKEGRDGPVRSDEEVKEEEGEYERFKGFVLGRAAEPSEEVERRVMEEVEQFEVVPVDEEEAEEEKEGPVKEKEGPVEEKEGPVEEKGGGGEKKAVRRTAEPPKRPEACGKLDPENVKLAVAFGAGALMGYLLKDFLEGGEEEEEELMEAETVEYQEE